VGGAAPVEALEDPVLLLGRDSLPGVLDLDLHDSTLAADRAKPDHPRRGGVIAGVREQPDQHLEQEHPVADRDQVGLDSPVDLDPLRRVHGRKSLLRRQRDVHDLGLLPLPGRLDPGKGEQRLHQPGHPLGVVGEAAEEALAGVRIVLRPALEDLDRA
jgi:hypothetical protein